MSKRFGERRNVLEEVRGTINTIPESKIYGKMGSEKITRSEGADQVCNVLTRMRSRREGARFTSEPILVQASRPGPVIGLRRHVSPQH